MKIMLDAGHAGKTNKGAVSGYYESEVVWKLHLLLKVALESYGFEVGATRQTLNKDLTPVEERGKLAKGYDLFLSLHTNASGDTSIDRPVMICFQDLDWTNIDDVSKAIGHKLGAAIQAVMGTQKYQIYQRKSIGDRDKNGIEDDEYYGVLYGSRLVGVPGVIVEHTFHTNPRAAAWLLDDKNLAALAEAEAKALAEYYGLEKPKAKEYAVKVTAAALNVRSGAGTSNPVVTTVVKGDVLTITDKKQVGAITWGKCSKGWLGLTGYTEKVTTPIPAPEVVLPEPEKPSKLIPQTPPAVQPTPPEPQKPIKPVLKSATEIANEVIRGLWGSGQVRVNRLAAAGYNAKTIQSTVNILLKK